MFPIIQLSRAGLFPRRHKDFKWVSVCPYVRALCLIPLSCCWSDTMAGPVPVTEWDWEQTCLRTSMLQAGSVCYWLWNLATQVQAGLWSWPGKVLCANTVALSLPSFWNFLPLPLGQAPRVFWNASFILDEGFFSHVPQCFTQSDLVSYLHFFSYRRSAISQGLGSFCIPGRPSKY